jgi:outer membrane protein
MPRWTWSVAAAILGGAWMTSVGAAQAPNRIGFVNTQRLLAEAPGAQEAQRTFETEMRRFQAQVDSLENELERLRADFERQQSALTQAARQQRQEELQRKFNDFQQRVAQIEQQAQQRRQQLLEPVTRRIGEAIEQVRREGNYALILDAASGVIVSADPALDLTNQVLAKLRQTTPASSNRPSS